MGIRIKVALSPDWVNQHSGDEVKPIAYIKYFVREKFWRFLDMEKTTDTELSMTVRTYNADVEEITGSIKKEFSEHYGINSDSNVIEIAVEKTEAPRRRPPAPSEDDAKKKSAPADLDFEREGHFCDDPEEGGDDEPKEGKPEGGEAKGEDDPKRKEDTSRAEDRNDDIPEGPKVSVIDNCIAQFEALTGAEELKTLACEIRDIAPQIIKNNTYDVFYNQAYVFSINDGYGLTTYLDLLMKLLCAVKVKKNSSGGKVIEEKLPPPKGNTDEPFARIRQILGRSNSVKNSDRSNVEILCIDISEWLNQIDSHLFRDFLYEVQRNMSSLFVVFRVPFVDKEVLEKVKYSLGDLMFVRTVSFPPFTKSEIQGYAQREFDKYGFKMSSSAWSCFHERIIEEKSDGKFYGLNTIKKVVRELLYKKQLSNARRDKSDFCITKKDAIAICSGLNNEGSGFEMLDSMVGSEYLRRRIEEIISQIEFARVESSMKAPCIHMRFVGNPGTGKTSVARIVGKILKERGVLRIGNFHEYAGRDFCGRYVGETAPKTASMCRDAYGSVLFIDEAYSLYRGDDNERDYGREALDTLIAEMENHRSDLVVIMAGYTDDMEKLMRGNAGLASRMPYCIEFPNFTREQLYEIYVSMLNKGVRYDEDILPLAREYFMSIPDEIINSKEFSNGRFVRNLFERTCAKAAMRCQLSKINTVSLTREDFDRSVSDKEFTFIMKKKKIGFAD